MVLVYGGRRGQKNMTIEILLFTDSNYSFHFFFLLEIEWSWVIPRLLYVFVTEHTSICSPSKASITLTLEHLTIFHCLCSHNTPDTGKFYYINLPRESKCIEIFIWCPEWNSNLSLCSFDSAWDHSSAPQKEIQDILNTKQGVTHRQTWKKWN